MEYFTSEYFDLRDDVERFLTREARKNREQYVGANDIMAAFGRAEVLYHILQMLMGSDCITLHFNDDDIFGVWVHDRLLQKWSER